MRLLSKLAISMMLINFHHASASDVFSPLPFGDIKPAGWINSQMQHDIDDGFVGHLDNLVPDLIKEDDIYGDERRTRLIKKKSVGTHTTGADWEVQFLWWNSETQSNWWDGYLRNVLLLDDEQQINKINSYIKAKLLTQDKDGYIGVYGTDLRYQHSTENGELWAQSSLFRGLLAYYESSKDESVLTAVVRAVDVTMNAYPIDKSEPFKATDPFAGVGHGLTFTDVLNTLHRLTGDNKYLDYATFLFEDYNKHKLSEVDIHVNNLLDQDYRFKGHGVHTYEHLRALTIAAFHSDNKRYTQALAAYLEKLDTVLTASGAPIGDEWVGERHAHHEDTGYEYCSLQELLDSYSLLLQKTGEAIWAERMEWLLYNAAQGARNPDGKSIAYCKTDNSFDMQGHIDMNAEVLQDEKRFKYSPAHQDVAVCCAPNAGRIYPYFVQNMYSFNEQGIVANLYGPAKVDTKINGKQVSISQKTNYPFSLTMEFSVDAPQKNNFRFLLRKPSWATGVELADVPYKEVGEYIVIEKDWYKQTSFRLTFSAKAEVNQHPNDMVGVSYGPLLYALPIDHDAMVDTDKTYQVKGFNDLFYKSQTTEKHDYQLNKNTTFIFNGSEQDTWLQPPVISGAFFDPSENKVVNASLIPMGSTILRKVSFELTTKNNKQ